MVRSRSAEAPTVVVTLSVLLDVLVSATPLSTVAVLVKLPVELGVTTMTTVATFSLATVPRSQVMVLAPLQLPWLGFEETKKH